MKKCLFLIPILCMVFGYQQAAADTSALIAVGDSMMELGNIISKGLPVLYVQTVDGEEPTCDYVSAPAGCMGKTITNATKVPGRMVIYQRVDNMDSLMYDSGDYEKGISGMTIKIRGNTSAYGTKKPYKIKLEKKHDLFFRGDQATYKDKDWVLLKFDYLLSFAGFKVNEMLGLPWTPAHHFVNLIVNDSYRGVYLMCESVKRNPDCRLNVDKFSGYIFECDPYWWNEDVYVNSITSPSYNFTFKYPDSDDILPEQLEYIQGVVTAFENSLTKANYPDLIDVPSFAAWCLGHDVLGTKDSGGANRYYTKYDSTDTSKIFMPLLWDFDMSERTANAWSQSHIKHFSSLFNNANRTFVDEYCGLWRKVSARFYSNIHNYLVLFFDKPEGKALEASLGVESILWNYTYPSIQSNIMDRIVWYDPRVKWLNNAVNTLNPVGDTNIDGLVNISDVTFLIDELLGSSTVYRYAGDVDRDGTMRIADVTALIDQMLSAV